MGLGSWPSSLWAVLGVGEAGGLAFLSWLGRSRQQVGWGALLPSLGALLDPPACLWGKAMGLQAPWPLLGGLWLLAGMGGNGASMKGGVAWSWWSACARGIQWCFVVAWYRALSSGGLFGTSTLAELWRQPWSWSALGALAEVGLCQGLWDLSTYGSSWRLGWGSCFIARAGASGPFGFGLCSMSRSLKGKGG